MARVRHVYSTNEIAHRWFHNENPDTQERNPGNNFYYDGDVIYSYGGHFPIARKVRSNDGAQAVLFTSREYSVTTSKHKHLVRCAIPSYVPQFYVPNVPRYDVSFTACLSDLADKARRLRAELDTTTRKPSRVKIYRSLWAVDTNCQEFASFFGLTYESQLPEQSVCEELASLDLKYRAAAVARSEAAHRAVEEQWQRRREQWQRQYEQAEAESKKTDAEIIEEWRSGKPIRNTWRLASLPTMLRISGDEVETSKGARFPVAHAIRCLGFVRTVREKGVEYQRNGHTLYLGVYAIDRIEPDGTVHAGCHVVSWAEIERIAPQLDRRATGEWNQEVARAILDAEKEASGAR